MRKIVPAPKNAKLLPKPGKRLMKILDPKAYIVQELVDAKRPEWGWNFRVYSGNGKPYVRCRLPKDAWARSSARLRNEIVERAARGIGLI